MTAAGSATPAPQVRLVVGETAAARIAAQAAGRVPGVLGLPPDLGQMLLGVAGSVLGHDRSRRPTDGVRAEIGVGTVVVSVTVATTLGHNCRDLAVAVQRAVADEVHAQTGLVATVRVTVAEVLVD